jgi:hypothetical protein
VWQVVCSSSRFQENKNIVNPAAECMAEVI